MPAVTAYIGRMSYLLRQGKSANQVAILLPTDDAWAGFRPTQTTRYRSHGRLHVSPLMSPILSAGYNVDFIDADAINKVGLGTHQILVIPPTDRIPLETLRKIAAFYRGWGQGHLPSAARPRSIPKARPLNSTFGTAVRSGNVARARRSRAWPTP